jgi:hypothetical protein
MTLSDFLALPIVCLISMAVAALALLWLAAMGAADLWHWIRRKD